MGSLLSGFQRIIGPKTFAHKVTFENDIKLGTRRNILGIARLTGGWRGGVKAVSGSWNVIDTDGVEYLAVTTGSSAVTVGLPPAGISKGRLLTVRKVDSGTGKITVDGEGAETIDGNTTAGIWYQDNFLTLLCDGTGWVIIGAPNVILIPEASRPSDWVLKGGTATTFTDVDWSLYTPPGAKALLLQCGFIWTGNGSADTSLWELRKNGSSSTNWIQLGHVGITRTDLPNGIALNSWGCEKLVSCDVGRIIEYRFYAGAAAVGALYLTINGYSMMG